MRLKALEDLLRRRLLIRNKTGVTMTAAGVRFHRFAEILVKTWQMTRRQMSLASGFDGILSVGSDQALWDDLMFSWVCNTRRERPDIAIRCESGNADYLMNRLFEGWLDLCVVYEARTISGYTVEPLFDDPLVLASTERRALKQDWDPGYVQIDWDEGVRAQEESFWGEVDETAHLSVMGAGLGTRFVMEFGGSALVPLRSIRNGSFAGRLHPIEGSPVLDRTAYLIYSQELLKERLPNLSIEHIRDSIRDQIIHTPPECRSSKGVPETQV
jgi:DNA-binding transcriptional LysR family regulator